MEPVAGKILIQTTRIMIKTKKETTYFKSKNGASIVEYIVLMIIILGALYVMQDSISHGIFARHKIAGDSFAFGRQYDGKRTVTCRQDVAYYKNDATPVMGIFYDEDCYQ